MGLFDKMKKSDDDISFPEPPSEDVKPAFPEPPKPMDDDELDDIKERVETPIQMEEPMKKEEISDELEEEMEDEDLPSYEPPRRGFIPEPVMPTTINPTLYIKLSEYKEVVEATNKMRKDIEKTKEIVSELRLIEKDEHSKLEKSEELLRDIDKIISLFEKTMVTPIE
ncbi:MAG: hypothetical protein JW791_00510 [Nanoarchaeota archaeon]|nr:hypothetical protein [Nanoarchaeota archaeon]